MKRTNVQAASSEAAGDGTALGAIYLRIDGMPGGSTDVGHEGWIRISSFNQSITQPGAPAEGGEAYVSFSQLDLHKAMDKSSTYLAAAVCSQDCRPEAVLRLCDDKGKPFFELAMEDVLVSGYMVSASMGEAGPDENLLLSFKRIKWTRFAPGGANDSGSWDIVANKTW